jgi:integrase
VIIFVHGITGDAGLKKLFNACTAPERAVFSVFLFTGFREQEAVNLCWPDINAKLNTIRMTLKPDLGFSPKRWE